MPEPSPPFSVSLNDKQPSGFKQDSKIIFTDTCQTSHKKNKAKQKTCISSDKGCGRSPHVSESNSDLGCESTSEGQKSRQMSESSDQSEGSESFTQVPDLSGSKLYNYIAGFFSDILDVAFSK